MVKNNSINVSVDAVVFNYYCKNLYVLMVKRKTSPLKDCWSLPGGLLSEDLDIEDAVKYKLKEKADFKINHLEQLYAFDGIDRDPRNRVVSIAYFALVKSTIHIVSNNVKWFDINNIPEELAFDHLKIFTIAKQRLQTKLQYEPIGFNLLDNKFVFSDLENLYEAILEKKIDRRNFRKKMIKFGILEALDIRNSKGRGRPAQLFKFNKQKYFNLKKTGLIFELK